MNYIVDGVCTVEGLEQCFEPYACDACPYNLYSKLEERLLIGL